MITSLNTFYRQRRFRQYTHIPTSYVYKYMSSISIPARSLVWGLAVA